MKTQFRDPDGLLNCLSSLTADDPVFDVLLHAAEEFDPCMIRRNAHISDEQRDLLLERGTNPLPLKAQVRTHFRRLFGRNLPEFVPSLFAPQTLKNYLLYCHC